MLRRITWRFWLALAAAVTAYFIAGVWYSDNGRVETDIYAYGLLLAAVTPLLYVAVYAKGSKGWRENDLGVNLAFANLGLLPMCGILAWVFLVDHGALHSTWLAWAEVGSPWWLVFFINWRDWIMVRMRRDGKAGTAVTHAPDDDSGA